MDRNRLYKGIFGGFFIVLAVIFTWLFRDQVESLIVTPLIHWVWYIKSMARSLNPEIVWGFFVFFLFILTIITFPISKRPLQKKIYSATQTPDSRIEFWIAELSLLQRKRSISKLYLIALKRLTLEIIAYREYFDSRQEAERWVKENSHLYPQEINTLITKDPGLFVRPHRVSLMSRLNSLFHLHSHEEQVPRMMDTEIIEEIIQFLESQIEVVNEYENP